MYEGSTDGVIVANANVILEARIWRGVMSHVARDESTGEHLHCNAVRHGRRGGDIVITLSA